MKKVRETVVRGLALLLRLSLLLLHELLQEVIWLLLLFLLLWRGGLVLLLMGRGNSATDPATNCGQKLTYIKLRCRCLSWLRGGCRRLRRLAECCKCGHNVLRGVGCRTMWLLLRLLE